MKPPVRAGSRSKGVETEDLLLVLVERGKHIHRGGEYVNKLSVSRVGNESVKEYFSAPYLERLPCTRFTLICAPFFFYAGS
jgi:hypothetical protein